MDARCITVGPNNTDVHYFRAGKGELLLYLHHLLGQIDFEPALQTLAESYDVIAPYLPGWGPAKDQLFDIGDGPLDLVLLLDDFLSALNVSGANTVGISIGAWVAAELAAIKPERVKKLMLVNPLGIWRDEIQGADPFAQHPGSPSQILFAAGDGRKQYLIGDRDKLEAHVDELLSLRAGAKFLWPIPDTGVEQRLPRIKCPTLIATSSADKIVPTEYGPIWQDAIMGAQLQVLDGCGHLAELESPAVFVKAVKDFMGDAAISNVA